MPPKISKSIDYATFDISSLLDLRPAKIDLSYRDLMGPSVKCLPICVSHAYISTFHVSIQNGLFDFTKSKVLYPVYDHPSCLPNIYLLMGANIAYVNSPGEIHSQQVDSSKQGYAESTIRESGEYNSSRSVQPLTRCCPVGIQDTGVPVLETLYDGCKVLSRQLLSNLSPLDRLQSEWSQNDGVPIFEGRLDAMPGLVSCVKLETMISPPAPTTKVFMISLPLRFGAIFVSLIPAPILPLLFMLMVYPNLNSRRNKLLVVSCLTQIPHVRASLM